MQFKFVLMVFSCFALRDCSAYMLTCGTQVTLTLEAADLTTLQLDPPNEKRFSISTTEETTYSPTDPCQVFDSDTITFDATQCGAVVSRDVTHQIFTYKLFKLVLDTDFTPNVARFKDSCLEFVCKFPLQNFVSSTFLPTVEKVSDSTVADGTFSFTMAFFDSGFTTPVATPVVIIVPDQAYVKVSLTVTGSPSLQLQAKTCYVNKAADKTAMPQYQIITDFCVANAADGQTMPMNRAGTDVTFSFTSFVFSEDVISNTQYYVHCVLEVCDPGQTASCDSTAPCAKRKRRFAPVSQSNNEQHHVSYGPIQIINTCSNNNGGCEEICSMAENQIKCSCSAGKMLSSNGRTCLGLEINQSEIVMESSNASSYYYMAGIVAIGVLVLLMAALVFFKSSPRSSLKGASRFESA